MASWVTIHFGNHAVHQEYDPGGEYSNRSVSRPITAWYGLPCFVAQSNLDATKFGKKVLSFLLLLLLLLDDCEADVISLLCCKSSLDVASSSAKGLNDDIDVIVLDTALCIDDVQ